MASPSAPSTRASRQERAAARRARRVRVGEQSTKERGGTSTRARHPGVLYCNPHALPPPVPVRPVRSQVLYRRVGRQAKSREVHSQIRSAMPDRWVGRLVAVALLCCMVGFVASKWLLQTLMALR